MQRLVFWLVFPFLWVISKFPFWLFYKVSDLIFFIVYYLVGYRRKTVTENLKLALPGKSETEYKRISKRSFQHMCDMFLEMVKSISIPSNELKGVTPLPTSVKFSVYEISIKALFLSAGIMLVMNG